jgi:uridine kinase
VKPLVIGIAGGTGSGKTTVARKLFESLPGSCVLIEHDWYYRDRGHMPEVERESLNYDHPEALDSELLAEHLAALRGGATIAAPIYDYKSHTRSRDHRSIAPAPVVIVEGILVLAEPGLRAQMDIKVFVDTDADIRVLRRIRRDLEQRGRSFASVRDQYYQSVRPMHLQFVEPSKRWADLILPEGGENQVAIDVLLSRLQRTQKA